MCCRLYYSYLLRIHATSTGKNINRQLLTLRLVINWYSGSISEGTFVKHRAWFFPFDKIYPVTVGVN
jgi:hypothetical protein